MKSFGQCSLLEVKSWVLGRLWTILSAGVVELPRVMHDDVELVLYVLVETAYCWG